MKKMLTLAMMLMMLCSFSMTAYAAEKNPAQSPSGKPTTEENETEVPSGTKSPATGESDMVLYGLGMTAVVLASGAVIVRKKAM